MTISEKVALLRKGFDSGKTLPVEARVASLERLRGVLKRREANVLAALHTDLNKAAQEAYMTELGLVLDELNGAIRSVRGWARPTRVRAPFSQFPASARIYHQPHGVVLIMSPWNYPFMLTMAPLIGAIAGGNCALVKPSAYAPATSALIEALLAEAFDTDVVSVVTGGRKENQALLEEQFDYVFFTGSVAVGKVVMHACAEHLTPLTLELGGKSPAIVTRDADIPLAAKRLAWAKLINAGQTCVAPDYVLAHASVAKELIEGIKKEIAVLYGNDPLHNPQYPHIISDKHFERVRGLLADGHTELGGQFDAETRAIAPTVLSGVDWASPVMQEEIFGPILPVLTYEDFDEMLGQIAARPRPLALYLFTSNADTEREVMTRVHFGGGCVNDCLVHLATKYMPFGGVGESGMGNYHGKWSFRTFTREKSVLKRGKLDLPIRYAPYTEKKLSLVRRLLG